LAIQDLHLLEDGGFSRLAGTEQEQLDLVLLLAVVFGIDGVNLARLFERELFLGGKLRRARSHGCSGRRGAWTSGQSVDFDCLAAVTPGCLTMGTLGPLRHKDFAPMPAVTAGTPAENSPIFAFCARR
jgi:hypothetical protein